MRETPAILPHQIIWHALDSENKSYSQAHLPISGQRTATGHAVRFVYLMTAVAHLARLRQNEQQRQACLRLWQSIPRTRKVARRLG
ncbi:glycoside hydrolase family 127 protein [Bradyrhizobium sp. BRP22]|nr:glycoside hydrolase family 127 protein [Bradyrhizobium sp. BRP22]